jgi:hypothetical protein
MKEVPETEAKRKEANSSKCYPTSKGGEKPKMQSQGKPDGNGNRLTILAAG